MTIDPELLPEMLMAYADGELDPIGAKRVERAIASDSLLAEQIEQHRQLRATLKESFDPIVKAPLPGKLRSLVPSAPVVDIAAARAARSGPPLTRRWSAWATGGAIAASVLLGLMIGQRIDQGPVASRGGALVASGGLAQTLDTQLASSQPSNSPLRILVSFRDQSGSVCRGFSGEAISGIACRDDRGWVLRETRGGMRPGTTEFRQAGSADAALLADAQAMMADDPLDGEAEAKAKANDWRQ